MARSFGGWAGARLPLAVAGFAALSSLAALAVSGFTGAFSDGRSAALEDELSSHQAIGEQALQALDEAKQELETQRAQLNAERSRAAAYRASELALLGTQRAAEARRKSGTARLVLPSTWKLEKNEHLALLRGDGTQGSSLAAGLAALKETPRERIAPYPAADERGAWAVSAGLGDDLFVVARVDLAPAPAAQTSAHDRARRVIGALAAPEIAAGESDGGLAILLLAAALLAAVGGALWAWLRVTAPLGVAVDAAREFAHGRADARAEPERGGRDAREVAVAINALIERAERATEKGRAAQGDDLSNAILSIEQLGKGDLRDPIASPGPTHGPISLAIDGARRDLLERVTEMHSAALQVATRAAELAPASRQLTDAAGEQLSSLRRLGSSSDETVDEMRRKAAELEIALNTLITTAQEHRHAIQELRASLSGLSRRVMALRGTAEEAQALSARAETIDQALSMLSRLAGQSDSGTTKTRATALVGDARAALAEIGEKLQALQQEMLRAAHGLEILAQSQPEAPKMFEASVTQPFYDAIAILVRTLELTVGCVTAVERSTKNASAASEAMFLTARQTIELLPRLGTALSSIRLGTSFEEQLLERLGRMKAEVEAAKRTDGLTPDGERMLAEVNEASEAARAKLTRLAQATEAALRAMRG